MRQKDWLTEDDVIEGTVQFLKRKGCTVTRQVVSKASAARKEHGPDLVMKLANEQHRGNRYIIEAKGNLRSDGRRMSSSVNTNFRWALSQIILRIKNDSRKYNYNYGIAMPRSDAELCIKLIRKNWALKHLKIRLYGAYRENDELTAVEYLPSDIYD